MPPAFLFLLLPPRGGGETFPVGSNVNIEWSSVGEISMIDIDFSMDGGATWTSIVSGTENDGLYAWSPPAVASNTMRVRIRDSSRADVFAESDNFSFSSSTEVTLVDFGAIWEYHDSAEAPDSDWNTTVTGWSQGPAELGYGDGDEATELLDTDPNVPTVYFRRNIELEGTLTDATLEVLFDDAIAVFINGTQVYGINVDNGLDHDVFASMGSSDNQREMTNINVDAFRMGSNVVSAIVKQASAGSSDLSFDLRLVGTVEAPIEPGPDGGVGTDGGSSTGDSGTSSGRDGSSNPDAGGDDSGSGCGCRSVGLSNAAGIFPLLCVLLFYRKRWNRM